MTLKEFLQTMTLRQRDRFAERVGTTGGHLRNVSYGYKKAAESLAINIERESHGIVTVEELRPDVDWRVIRDSRVRRRVNQVGEAA
jgi:DNA-binding transcriptional regulator YdaS (Cro superfamily)